MQEDMSSFYRPSITGLPELRLVADDLWEQSVLRPSDIQTAVLYDHSPPSCCSIRGAGILQAWRCEPFIAYGHIALNGSIPVNPQGGQIGEDYIHGVNGIAEGQIRGTAANQVSKVEHVLVTAGTAVPTGALILGV